MPYEIAELLAILTMFFLVGTFILLFPISRRLGKAIEEWVKIRHESLPERDLLARIEVELVEIRNQFDGMDQRMDFLAERQDTAGLLNGGVPFDVNSLQLDVNFNYK